MSEPHTPDASKSTPVLDDPICDLSYTYHARSVIWLMVFLLYLFITRVFQRSFLTFWLKSIVGGLLMSIISLLGIPFSIFMFIIGQGKYTNYFVAHTYGFLILPLISVKLRIEGWENTKDHAVYMANHQSFLDLILLPWAFPSRCVIVAKDIFKYYGPVGLYMYLSKNIYVKRQDRKKAVSTMDAAAEDARRKGVSIFIFVEGTRSHLKTLDLLPFKKGPFHLAIKTGHPIVPCVFSSFRTFFDGDKWQFMSGEVTIRFTKPIPTEGYSTDDMENLMSNVREDMLATYRSISQ